MGRKNKKKDRHRSRSHSRERERKKEKERRKKKRTHSDSSAGSPAEKSPASARSSSPERSRKRHRERSRSRDREQKQSKSQSTSKRKERRSRSRSRSKEHLTAQDVERLNEERRKEKDLMKALETPEEKRARRLAKKEAKKKKMKEEMGWDAEYMGYTNADNPFGDEHLLDTFVWQKKFASEGMESLPTAAMEKLHKTKMIENKIELEKVKKRRLEREQEREERDKEREIEQRDKESEYFSAWERQEDTFHLQQAKLRSKIRIEDGRAKPIDLLGKYISAEDDELTVEMHEPYTYLNGLTMTDLEDLLEDIKVYMELEQGKNVEYWRDITIIVEEELDKLRKLDPGSRHYVGDRRTGINQSVSDDISSVFKGKSLMQLELLGNSISNKLKGGEGVDVGYWESLLQQLKAHMAKTRLKERHQDQLRRKLFKLKQEQGIESDPLFPIMRQGSPEPSGAAEAMQSDEQATEVEMEPQPGPSTSRMPEEKEETQEVKEEEEDEEEEEEEEAVITEEDILDQSYDDYESGRYSPVLLKTNELEADTLVYDPEDDIKRLDYARRLVLKTGQAKKDSDEDLMKKAREGMNDEEAQFSVEVPLEKQTLLWSDKYRPRKPRFFNRVHTGFEWNKYNQTHYDIDNPPPKIVQGYKFNIFYPDLIDKADTPQYTLTPMEDSKDFAMLKFTTGPPYEDIAFKIVNREWEYSYKRGFRCQFQNNIFQLWFHFKRYRYRR